MFYFPGTPTSNVDDAVLDNDIAGIVDVDAVAKRSTGRLRSLRPGSQEEPSLPDDEQNRFGVARR